MVFANLIFLFAFLPLNLLLYNLSGNRTYRNLVLVIFSLFFYAWGEPVWVLLLLFSASIDYLHGRIIERYRGGWQAKAALLSSLLINLGLLGLFKYSGFLVGALNGILGLSLSVPAFSLPIGISFYTFQTISYVVDVYRGEVAAQQSYLKYVMYLSLYPQLVAGPIVRYSQVAEEVDNRTTSVQDISSGITRFSIGLTKKVAVANVAGQLLLPYMEGDLTKLTVLGGWWGALLFSLQIYYDFSGYSDMAIGLGRMFGFHYAENFYYPYIANSITDFWRRWHISLSSFFRDYVYIPLGGNRTHQYRNLFVVWFLTGLWHGASWNFILWGLYFGFFIACERLFLGNWLKKMPAVLRSLYVLPLLAVGWVLFYFVDLSQGMQYLSVMFGLAGAPLTNLSTNLSIAGNCWWLLLAIVFCLPITQLFNRCVMLEEPNRQRVVLWMQPVFNLLLLLFCVALLAGQSYNPFLYFRF